ncbi:MAG TPA: hypothetical protein ACQGQH_04645 [Xylella sp.]
MRVGSVLLSGPQCGEDKHHADVWATLELAEKTVQIRLLLFGEMIKNCHCICWQSVVKSLSTPASLSQDEVTVARPHDANPLLYCWHHDTGHTSEAVNVVLLQG